ncbi:transcriptional regulator (plasmid) [Bradyrhizobium diazoefficiens]|nr:transcriptional regulator [Bradyrhizobium diazoefficiens]
MTTKAFLSHFGLQTLRDLPDMEMLEEAGLLSKDKMLAESFLCWRRTRPTNSRRTDEDSDVA